MEQDHDKNESRLIEQLRESEQRFRGAFETAAIGMALVSLEGRWLDVNASLCDIVGYHRDELLVTDFQTITHPDDLDADLNLLNQLVAGEIPSYRMGKRYFHKSGRLVWVVLSVSLVRNAAGEPLHFVSQIEDVTQQKEARTALEQTNRELDQFAAVVSHDLKAPLRGVRGFARLLRERATDELSPQSLELLGMIDASIDRADALVDDLLALARVGQSGEQESVDTRTVLGDVLFDLGPELDAVDARVDTGDLLPVRSTEASIRQLLQNLLVNAIKFRDETRPLRITVDCQRRMNEAIFAVIDNGRGIQPRHAERVFRVFERLHGDEVEGTGIGLAICKKVVERAGGRISIEPNAMVGVTVRFALPVALPAD
ncbi:PAS domain S-box protein [uncultured Abyssibacter sp.]|uniref:sensor histidine kinase n=1 Tax=uncultured Abyssibacter sp. TaxID=2320202 RepID=UPI0032B1E5F5